MDHFAKNNLPHLILFLDFKKAFDSVFHQMLFELLHHIGIPDEFITWIQIMYYDSILLVHHNNWLTVPFSLDKGVRQGCPLLCHLFNLVGQILIFYLWDQGFFAWWSKPGDPYSLYADDTALFIIDASQLSSIIQAIYYVGTFTGLNLNLEKMIVFLPSQTKPIFVSGVQIDSRPVKYLGAYLGLGDLSCKNFKVPLRKLRMKMNKWNKRILLLFAQVTVIKTFLYSLFAHVLNLVFIATDQLNLLKMNFYGEAGVRLSRVPVVHWSRKAASIWFMSRIVFTFSGWNGFRGFVKILALLGRDLSGLTSLT